MKLIPRDAARYCRKPDPEAAGLLIYGADAMRVATRRQEVIAALVGPEAEAEMRLTRISGAELRKDAALLHDAIKAQGFFPGPRVAFVEEATDGTAKAIEPALADWAPGDAQVIVTAGALTARSTLRKLFEGHKQAYAVGIYDDPPDRAEIEGILAEAGLARVPGDVMAAITDLSRALDPGDFRQTLQKLGLYKLGDATPVTVEDLDLCAPRSSEAELDDLLHIVAESRVGEIGPVLSRLYAQGSNPVGLCIGTTRHFRSLHAAASDPGGPAAGIARLRPPIHGPRRDRMARQAGKWGRTRLEQALTYLTDTDLRLRSSSHAPAQALMERALIRLAMLGR
ncbi:DNA polymerase III subunit delta [Salibaculum sp.]|jgi:DNA polymerase-3 subunit delta|uniref:DNA polymerase III subunit delta n=1 Tax=Roseovarius halophilus (ex Wu et al. 2025) TaxID=3376060 RepID=UPI00286FC4F6|nr:DNA polymerase III subunit delta [Salibaculum sp.]MDR9428992.1 DNA polymerase III subunit delta [Salibaculum sp.]